MNETMPSRPWVLVEGPKPGDAEFLGRWLLTAVKADQELEDQLQRNPDLREQISTIESAYIVAFSPAATKFLEELMRSLSSFPLALSEEPWGELFAIMAELGFFYLTGDRYQMIIPKELSGAKIEAALLRLAATEDEEYLLHPEYLIHGMSEREARDWHMRLDRLPWMQRVADRALLLGEN